LGILFAEEYNFGAVEEWLFAKSTDKTGVIALFYPPELLLLRALLVVFGVFGG